MNLKQAAFRPLADNAASKLRASCIFLKRLQVALSRFEGPFNLCGDV